MNRDEQSAGAAVAFLLLCTWLLTSWAYADNNEKLGKIQTNPDYAYRMYLESKIDFEARVLKEELK